MTDIAQPLARRAHKALEPLHTLIYFTPEAGERYAALGIKGGLRGYFASRSAPMGVTTAEVVVATFYNFADAQVRKAIPSVWEVTTPDRVLEARTDAADAALRRLLPDDVDSPAMKEAAGLAREAAAALRVEGRPLYAGHASLPWPEPAHLQLWHAATLLREHRGDGHIAALVLAGLTGIEAALTYVATGHSALPEELQRATRGYSEEEWQACKDDLRSRGLVGDAGLLTAAGRELRDAIEAQTDRAAAAPYEQLGTAETERLIELTTPWARSVTKQLFG
jgi:hypothetical protein